MTITEHAQVRMEQRNLTIDAVQFALHFGRRINRGARTLWCVGWAELQSSDADIPDDFPGIVVVTPRDQPSTVITAYQDENWELLYI